MKARQTTSSKGERISSTQAAAILGITEHSLRTWRYEKRGPAWHTLGRKRRIKGKGSRPRVFYYRAEVEAFMNGGRHAGEKAGSTHRSAS